MRLRSSLLALVLVTFATALMIAVSLALPRLDMEITHLLFDPASGSFPVAVLSSYAWLREHGAATVTVLLGCMTLSAVAKLLLPRRPLLMPARVAIFLALTLALGPGLLINGVLKEFWGRPRPVEIAVFGGTHAFVPWWSGEGACASNCSFASGEASIAAWLVAPAILVPPPWRVVAVGAAAVFTIVVGSLRMAYGGHFLTDVIFGALLTVYVVWLVHGLIFRWPATRLNERELDRRLGNAILSVHRGLSVARRSTVG